MTTPNETPQPEIVTQDNHDDLIDMSLEDLMAMANGGQPAQASDQTDPQDEAKKTENEPAADKNPAADKEATAPESSTEEQKLTEDETKTVPLAALTTVRREEKAKQRSLQEEVEALKTQLQSLTTQVGTPSKDGATPPPQASQPDKQAVDPEEEDRAKYKEEIVYQDTKVIPALKSVLKQGLVALGKKLDAMEIDYATYEEHRFDLMEEHERKLQAVQARRREIESTLSQPTTREYYASHAQQIEQMALEFAQAEPWTTTLTDQQNARIESLVQAELAAEGLAGRKTLQAERRGFELFIQIGKELGLGALTQKPADASPSVPAARLSPVEAKRQFAQTQHPPATSTAGSSAGVIKTSGEQVMDNPDASYDDIMAVFGNNQAELERLVGLSN